jgi:putative glutathione S-transferase
MSIADARGFADPVNYEQFGYYSPYPKDGSTDRPLYQFRDRISSDGSTPYDAEPGRYHLYIALGCPWAHRAAIAIGLLGLTDVISISVVDDVRDGRGWAFRDRRGPDPINNFSFLKQAYLATDRGFEGHVNVPTLWDRKTARVVNNDNDDIFWDIISQFGAWARTPHDLYPRSLRSDIDALDAEIHENVNAGVYAAGLADSQADYAAAVIRVFETLDRLEARLENRRYLFGDEITESDLRLWVSLARFDVAYNPFFKANLRRLVDYPNLWAYARDLHSVPAFSELSDFDAFKFTYHRAFPQRNPSGIIPAGPIVDWTAPQQRAGLAGRAAA